MEDKFEVGDRTMHVYEAQHGDSDGLEASSYHENHAFEYRSSRVTIIRYLDV